MCSRGVHRYTHYKLHRVQQCAPRVEGSGKEPVTDDLCTVPTTDDYVYPISNSHSCT